MIAKKPEPETKQRKKKKNKTAENMEEINVKYELATNLQSESSQCCLYLSFAVLCKQGDRLKKIKLAHN
jgi:hypothetical protein